MKQVKRYKQEVIKVSTVKVLRSLRRLDWQKYIDKSTTLKGNRGLQCTNMANKELESLLKYEFSPTNVSKSFTSSKAYAQDE